ncbi:MAG: RHS repeat-associated core domain-containing protein, partial [Planctomycetia bacterium]
STGTTVNPFRWVGKYGYYTDNGTGQVYVRARMYQPTVARWVSADPIQFVDGLNTYRYVLNRGLVFTDSSGYQVDLALAPESPVGMKFSFADFISDRILGNTCRWFDLDVACRRCVEDCEPGFAPRYAYIYLQQAIIVDLENIDALGLDYRKTYGHEQLHVSNGIEKAKAFRKELEARLAKAKCITGDLELAELECKLEASKIALEFVTKWKEWEKLDSDHKLGKPERGKKYPPIDGKVGKTVSPNADVKECLQKVNDSNRLENTATNCGGAC